MPERSDEEMKRILDVIDVLVREVVANGKVSTARCHVCHEIISGERQGFSAIRISCPCGEYGGSLKGLLGGNGADQRLSPPPN